MTVSCVAFGSRINLTFPVTLTEYLICLYPSSCSGCPRPTLKKSSKHSAAFNRSICFFIVPHPVSRQLLLHFIIVCKIFFNLTIRIRYLQSGITCQLTFWLIPLYSFTLLLSTLSISFNQFSSSCIIIYIYIYSLIVLERVHLLRNAIKPAFVTHFLFSGRFLAESSAA